MPSRAARRRAPRPAAPRSSGSRRASSPPRERSPFARARENGARHPSPRSLPAYASRVRATDADTSRRDRGRRGAAGRRGGRGARQEERLPAVRSAGNRPYPVAMDCPTCGRSTPEAYVFCPDCGARLPRAASAPVAEPVTDPRAASAPAGRSLEERVRRLEREDAGRVAREGARGARRARGRVGARWRGAAPGTVSLIDRVRLWVPARTPGGGGATAPSTPRPRWPSAPRRAPGPSAARACRRGGPPRRPRPRRAGRRAWPRRASRGRRTRGRR
jgi:hypothetical protein